MSAGTTMAADFDIAIAGGGLAGSLIALALAERRPDLSVVLVEAGPQVGGNHIWSFFASDIDDANRALLEPMIAARWDDGYDVRFPAFWRTLPTGYRSITSERLAAHVAAVLPETSVLTGRAAHSLDADGITLEDGTRIGARGVIDARGIGAEQLRHLRGGWQKFAGAVLRTAQPHGLQRPIVMDATVRQHDGYRFVYCLPFSEDEVFVEDTYYSDTPDLNPAELMARIDRHAVREGWTVTGIEREETGVLPVVTDGDFTAFWHSGPPGVGRAGVRAGLFQPLTSYSLPDAVRFASFVAAMPRLNSAVLAIACRGYARKHWRRGQFFRLLARMLFGAAEPAERYTVLQHFYGLDEGLIERFYAGKSSAADKLRVLTGKPPVPVAKAAMVLAGIGAPTALKGLE